MEPKFINQYKVTFEIFQDWGKHPVGKKGIKNRKKGIMLRVVTAICGILVMIIGLLIQEFVFVYCGFVFLAVAMLRLFVLPNKVLKNQFNMVLKSQNSDVWINKFTFADDILYEYGNTASRYPYSHIIMFSEDSSYFYLFYNEDMVLRICKDSFVVGTADEFRDFWNSIISGRAMNQTDMNIQ